jgi:Rieske Fe-S protein
MNQAGIVNHSGETSRRSFLNIILGGGVIGLLGSILYPIMRFVLPPKLGEAVQSSVTAGKVGELKPNSGKIFKFGNRPGLLILTASGEYKAFSAVCTHLQCTVQYVPGQSKIWCACHNGQFNLNGEVMAGPPPKALEEYKVTVKGEEIIVSKA